MNVKLRFEDIVVIVISAFENAVVTRVHQHG